MSESWSPARLSGRSASPHALGGRDAGDWPAGAPPQIDKRPFPNAASPRDGESRASAAPAPEGALAAGGSKKVLALIDGLRLRRECLAHLLRTRLPDFDVVVAAGVHPVDAWRMPRPDIVLLDAPVAPSNGRGPMQEIAEAVAAARDVPVLLLSDAGDPLDADAAAKFGVAGLFPSNWETSLLIAAIQLVLAGGRFHIPANQPAASQSPLGDGARGFR